MNQQLMRYHQEADALSSQPLNPQSRARLQFLQSAIKTMREFGLTEAPDASRDTLAFRKKFLSEEARTYTPLNETSNGQIIPSDFEIRLKNLMLADGPLFAGSPLITNIYARSMTASKIAVSDDTASSGVVVDENIALTTDSELTGLTGVSIGGNSKRFSTGILLASVSLAEDVASWSSVEEVILKAASPRLSRIQNTTNLSALKTALAANSSAAISAAGSLPIVRADVSTLVSAVGAAYRPNAAFIMSSAIQKSISGIVDSNGALVYRHILEPQPTLLGYPVYVVASAAAGDILFGDFSYLYTKSTPVELRVLRERFRTEGYYGYLLSERAEAKWTVASTSDSPVKYLTFA